MAKEKIKIRSVINGFVVIDIYGQEKVAMSVDEVAEIIALNIRPYIVEMKCRNKRTVEFNIIDDGNEKS